MQRISLTPLSLARNSCPPSQNYKDDPECRNPDQLAAPGPVWRSARGAGRSLGSHWTGPAVQPSSPGGSSPVHPESP